MERLSKKYRVLRKNMPSGVYTRTKETLEKLKNNGGSMFGKKHTEEAKRKIGLKSKGRCADEKHPNWKGDNVSYRSLHKWVQRKLGKAMKCTNDSSHISTVYHWANISQEYKRDLLDWRQLCPSCNGLERRVS